MNGNFKNLVLILLLAAAATLIFSSAAMASDGGPAYPIVGISGDSNIDKYNKALQEKKPILIDNYSPTCGPCNRLAPILNELERTWRGKVLFVRFDLTNGNYQRYAQTNGISAVPTLQFIKEGRIVKTLVGTQPKSVINTELENLTR